MVGVAQLAEHLVVAQVVVGSSPITHPIKKSPLSNYFVARGFTYAPVAQLDRAPDFESVGRGFESLRARHRNQGFLRNTAKSPFFILCQSCANFLKLLSQT